MRSPKQLLADGQYWLRTWIASREQVYFPLYRLIRERRVGLLSPTTQITIEGFPRSANSFAQRAFELANPGIDVAHHTHAPAQVIGSVRRGLPTLVLIREPTAALRSLLVQRPQIGPLVAAWSYVSFYRALLPYRPGFLLCTFEEVTRDMGDVIGRVNHRFGTSFGRYEHNARNVEVVFGQMDQAQTAHYGGIREHRIARPAAARDRMKQNVDLGAGGRWLGAAEDLYRLYLKDRAFPRG